MDSYDRFVELEAGAAPLAFRLRQATDDRYPAIVMLHGLTGDERSMWALEGAAPASALLVTPRGPHAQAQGGYAWNPAIQAWPPLVAEFSASVDKLERLLEFLADGYELDRERVVLMGFSNGAAMAFAAGMTPLRTPPIGLVAISGHLPEGGLDPLRDTPIFWSHGVQDSTIPISVARTDVARLRRHGCSVEFCEAEVGHKLGADCLDDLRGWYRQRFSRSGEKMR